MITKKNKYFLLFAIIPFFLGGCLGTRHLKENEKLLYSQRIRAPKHISEEDLRDLYIQRANRKLFGRLPIHYLVWLYYIGEQGYDQEEFVRKREKVEKKFNDRIAEVPVTKTRKINNLEFRKQKKIARLNDKIENGNTVMQWGEPLAVFDTANVKLTTERFSVYLFSKGYFNNTVTYKIVQPKELNKLVYVTYRVEPGAAYFIDSVSYAVSDTAILNLLLENERASIIKEGDQYDQDKFTQERERIDLLLKDNGYYDFSRQYVEFNVDTSYQDSNQIAVVVTIKEPARRGYHKKFTIDKVNFITDAGTSLQGTERSTRSYRDINFQYYENNYNLKILSQRVFIQPGNFYSRTNTFETQRQLANLDAFKFVNINYDTSGGRFVANVFTSALDRYQWSNEAGVNVTQGFPGPFYNISFKKRNVFKGFESFDLTGRIGFEGVASATSDENIYKSTEAGINASITFPQIIFPFRERTQFYLARYNPKTRLSTGYFYTDRPEYRRTNLSFAGTYTLENRRTTQYSFTFANVNVIDTVNTSQEFRAFLAEQGRAGNISLVNAFSPSFVNSFIFGTTWNKGNYGMSDKDAVFIRAQAESGGTIWNFFSPEIITRNGLQYFKYLRFSIDIRKTKILDRNTVLAYRLNTGVAYPYGDNQSVPYEKFFFAGGSNSVRAWRPRRLGPGSFRPNESEDVRANGLFDYSIEKPAEILIEGSIELRKSLYGFVDGAVFVDAGNVWSFREWVKQENDEVVANGNSKFYWDQFYKEIGIGTGFGIRFDFTFLILRFDVGIKVYDPAREPDERFVLHKMKFFGPFGRDKEPVIYNVGIGFPF